MGAMPLHLLKLSVGPATIDELEARIARHQAEATRLGQDPAPFHTTRMVPKRFSEIAGQGSIFWVMKGLVACRQPITAIEPFTGTDGIGRCRLVFAPELVPVLPRPCRPFQGWRYLEQRDAPSDLDRRAMSDLAAMPEPLRRELAALGLL